MYDYVVLDVFTRTPLEGNPVAVFLDATGLGAETMQLVRDAVMADPMAPVEMKGKSEPLSTFRLVEVIAQVEPRIIIPMH